jgi:AcrR family transcriptional regulator
MPGKRYHHGDLRRALLAVTLSLIERDDVAAVSLREVARRARVSYAAPYFHFRDKAELLAAVAEEGFRTLSAAVAEALRMHARSRPRARLVAVGKAYLDFAAAHRAHYRVMFLAEVGDRARFVSLHQVAGKALEALQALVAAVRPGATPARRRELAVIAWSAWHGLASLLHQEVLRNNPSLPAYEKLRDVTAYEVAALVAPRRRESYP